jgi:AmmeMemoRadiSam system protein B/AmmeMemoRadiSam system protein A
MYKLFVFVLSTIITMNMLAQSRSDDRTPYAAGRFYSADQATLKSDLSTLFSSCTKPGEDWKVRAIISPHAGYVFSGKTAASAFSSIPRKSVYKNIFLIGSSHIMAFEGASIYGSGDFITPLGKMKVNKDIAMKLKSDYKVFNFPETAHMEEHSLEVQIPFIQYYFTDQPEIIPIVIGTNNIKTIRSIADALRPYFIPENLFIISSDFSHYPPYKDAELVDSLTAESIVSKDPEKFLGTLRSNASKEIEGLATSMCGWTSGLTLLYLVANSPVLEFKKVYYCNSGDSKYGNKDEVVGYNAITLIEKGKGSDKMNKSNQKDESEVSFSKAETDQLFNIARTSIRMKLYENKQQKIDPATVPANLKRKMGAFVTLKINGNLRGCIGRFISEEPLYEVVNEMAVASAFNDNRFDPLSKDEFAKTEMEISVLGPLKKINNISEIIPGKHGIYIKKDFRTGTMLPQVLTENHWTIEQFLGYTSRDKAGIGWDGWKTADLFIYEAVVLEENKK